MMALLFWTNVFGMNPMKIEYAHLYVILGVICVLFTFCLIFLLYKFVKNSSESIILYIELLDFSSKILTNPENFFIFLSQLIKKSMSEILYNKFDNLVYIKCSLFDTLRLKKLITQKIPKLSSSFLKQRPKEMALSDYISKNESLVSNAFKNKEQFIRKQLSFQNSQIPKLDTKLISIKKSKTRNSQQSDYNKLDTYFIDVIKNRHFVDLTHINNIKEEAEEEDIEEKKITKTFKYTSNLQIINNSINDIDSHTNINNNNISIDNVYQAQGINNNYNNNYNVIRNENNDKIGENFVNNNSTENNFVSLEGCQSSNYNDSIFSEHKDLIKIDKAEETILRKKDKHKTVRRENKIVEVKRMSMFGNGPFSSFFLKKFNE